MPGMNRRPHASSRQAHPVTHRKLCGLRVAESRLEALTGEEEPKLPAEALGDALQDQFPGLGCSVHAHAPPVLKEVDAP